MSANFTKFVGMSVPPGPRSPASGVHLTGVGSADGSVYFLTAKKAERMVPCRRSTPRSSRPPRWSCSIPGCQKQVCEDLGISKSALHMWVSKNRAHHHGVEPAEDAASRAEQSKMLKRIRELEQENEILRRVTVCLSQANLKFGQARPK